MAPSPWLFLHVDKLLGHCKLFRCLPNLLRLHQPLLSSKFPSQISWIGSIQAFLLVFIGVLSGPLTDKGHFYILNVLGSFFVVFGLMMTSLCERYWEVMLAQGIAVGLGCGMLFVPSAAIIGQYFVQKRALASSLASIGSGLSKSSSSFWPVVVGNS